MLIITRKAGESIVIGDDIRITVTNVSRGYVKLGIDAPEHRLIWREEMVDGIEASEAEPTSYRD